MTWESPEEPIPAVNPASGSHLPHTEQELELVSLTRRERFVWDEAYLSGFCHGHIAGRRFVEDEIATLQREAARIVHRLAEIPERDREADKAWRSRVEARWSA